METLILSDWLSKLGQRPAAPGRSAEDAYYRDNAPGPRPVARPVIAVALLVGLLTLGIGGLVA